MSDPEKVELFVVQDRKNADQSWQTPGLMFASYDQAAEWAESAVSGCYAYEYVGLHSAKRGVQLRQYRIIRLVGEVVDDE